MIIKITAMSKLREVIDFDMDILVSYVNRVEVNVRDGIKSYKNKINVVHEEVIETGNLPLHHVIEACEGLDSERYNFYSVFEEYLPQLQRSSALITLCGVFEFHLIQLCNDLQQERANELKVELKDINGKGFDAVLTYLIKVVGIQFDKGTKDYFEIKNIWSVRNSFVHRNGIFTPEMRNYINANEHLSGDTIINIDNGFLIYVVNCYKTIFEIIYQALTNKYEVKHSA